MEVEDWPRVSEIYADGICDGSCNNRDECSGVEGLGCRSHDRAPAGCTNPRSRCRLDGAGSGIGPRCLWWCRGASVYVELSEAGRGIGRGLLGALIERSEATGLWTLQAGIFPENAPSVALHRKHGFREIGRRIRIGQMNGIWRDVLLFERRSTLVGFSESGVKMGCQNVKLFLGGPIACRDRIGHAGYRVVRGYRPLCCHRRLASGASCGSTSTSWLFREGPREKSRRHSRS